MKTNHPPSCLVAFLVWIVGSVSAYAPGAYVNATVSVGYNYLINPLHTPSDSIHTVLLNAPDGAQVWVWDVVNQSFGMPATYSAASGWNTDMQLPVGRGFVLWIPWPGPTPPAITFLGEVRLEGSFTNFVAGSNKFSLVGSIVPQSTSLSQLEYPGIDGELVYLWDSTNQHYMDAAAFFTGYGWSGDRGSNGPVIPLSQAFFVQRPGSDTNWIREFSISNAAKSSGASASDLGVRVISVSDDAVTLQIIEGAGLLYNVLFSSDGMNWRFVGKRQTGTVWTGRFPQTPCGYYRAVRVPK